MNKHTNIEDLVDHLRNYEYNFVGFVVTPWHLLGVRALLEKLKNEGRQIKHIICIMPHADTGYVFDLSNLPNDCVCLKEGETPVLQAVFVRKLYILFKSQIGNSVDPIYIASSWNYRINTTIYLAFRLNRKFILCKVDEGVATYMNTSNSLYKSIQSKNWKLFLRTVTSKVLQSLLRHPLNCNILLKKRGRLLQNEGIIPYYKKILFKKTSSSELSCKNLVILATMAFPKKEVYNNELGNKIGILISALKERGFYCAIKPHPREEHPYEDYLKYNVDIIDNTCSIEEYLIDKKPICLISFSSTSLITSKLFYNVKPISIINLLDLDNFSLKYYNEMNTFRKVFSDIVSFPNSVDEVVQEIMS